MPADEPIDMPNSVIELIHNNLALYNSPENATFSTTLFKECAPANLADAGADSSQGVTVGRKEHPFDFPAVIKFQNSNEYHSACIHAKVNSIVGLGFMTEEEKKQRTASATDSDPIQPISSPYKADFELPTVDKKLNPLCEKSFADVLNDVAEDWVQVGNGHIEVVRKGKARTTVSSAGSSRTTGEEITGLHHIPVADAHVVIENDLYEGHFEINSETEGGATRRFARFGDLNNFKKRMQDNQAGIFASEDASRDNISEVIHFRCPSSLSRWYGFPNWVSAVPSIELVQMMIQMKFDFFSNRGVPEFILLFSGAKLPEDDWKKVESAMKSQIGLGNMHKSIALNVTSETVEMTVEKLAMESKGDSDFKDMAENRSLSIVTAHRVPPLLAGIQIPGKLGATNELPNALMAFQLLVCGPAQRNIQQTLGCSLGDKEKSGLDLEFSDFAFKKITDEIDLGMMATVGGMRETVPEANANGRNLADGLKD